MAEYTEDFLRRLATFALEVQKSCEEAEFTIESVFISDGGSAQSATLSVYGGAARIRLGE